MMDLGLVDILLQFPQDAEIHPDAWLRSVRFSKVAHDMETLTIDYCEIRRPEYNKSCRDMAAILGEKHQSDLITGCIADLNCLGDIFGAGLEDSNITVKNAQVAMDAIESPKCFFLKQAFLKYPAGLAFVAPTRELLKRGASVKLGNDGADRAWGAITSEGFFMLDASDPRHFKLMNVSTVFNWECAVYDVLADVLQHALDSVKLWSPVRRHEQKPVTKKLLDGVVDRMGAAVICLSWLLHDLLSHTFSDIHDFLGKASDLQPLVWRHSGESDCLPSTTLKFFAANTDFVAAHSACIHQMSAFLDAVAQVHDDGEEGNDGAVRALASKSQKSQDNIATMQEIVLVCASLFDVLHDGLQWSDEKLLEQC